MGRHSLSFGKERDAHGEERFRLAESSQEAQGQTDAGQNPQGQCSQIHSARSKIEHIFAHQKGPMAAIIRTIGKARADAALISAEMKTDPPLKTRVMMIL